MPTAANYRIFYACQMVGLHKMGTDTVNPSSHTDGLTLAHGVQSVGITTNFNLEQAFELGQIQIYENIEGLPDVEVTLEKVLDGYALLYHLATPSPESVGMVGRGKERTDVGLGIFSDAVDSVTDGSQAKPPVEVFCSGMYMGNLSYTIPVDGNCTESITLTGNEKQWITTDNLKHMTSNGSSFGGATTDEPLALTQSSGGIQRRENVLLSSSIMPQALFGVDSAGFGNAYNLDTGAPPSHPSGTPRVHIQNISVSTDFSREDILELGRRVPYYKSPGFPIEVTCEIEAIAISGDFVNAYEGGDPSYVGSKNEGNNTAEEQIIIRLADSTVFDLGTKNRLSSVSYGGGDAGGGNVSISYSYTNFNDLEVLHRQDPARILGNVYTAAQSGLIGM
jgi:hypothetical protein